MKKTIIFAEDQQKYSFLSTFEPIFPGNDLSGYNEYTCQLAKMHVLDQTLSREDLCNEKLRHIVYLALIAHWQKQNNPYNRSSVFFDTISKITVSKGTISIYFGYHGNQELSSMSGQFKEIKLFQQYLKETLFLQSKLNQESTIIELKCTLPEFLRALINSNFMEDEQETRNLKLASKYALLTLLQEELKDKKFDAFGKKKTFVIFGKEERYTPNVITTLRNAVKDLPDIKNSQDLNQNAEKIEKAFETCIEQFESKFKSGHKPSDPENIAFYENHLKDFNMLRNKNISQLSFSTFGKE